MSPRRLPSILLPFHASPGSALRSSDMDALLDLRLRNVSLKTATDPALDRRKFSAWLERSTTVAWCEGAGEKPCALASWRVFDWTWQGHRRKGCAVEFLFIDKPYRGSLGLTVGMAQVFFRLVADARTANLWVGGGASYLPGAVALDRYVGPVHFLSDHSLEPEARQFLELAAAEAGIEVESDGRVDMRTLPASPSSGWHRRNEGQEAYRRYLALNPQWMEGYGMVCGSRLSAATLGRIATSAARRLARVAPGRFAWTAP